MIFRRKTPGEGLRAAVEALTGQHARAKPEPFRLRTVLLAPDGSRSPSALAARAWAFRLASAETSLQVISVGAADGGAAMFSGAAPDPEGAVRDVATEARRLGVKVDRTWVPRGDPALEIAHASQAGAADLLVVGNGGHSTLAFEGLGGTGGKVRDLAACSVLVTRRSLREGQVVCGVDGSAGSLQAAFAAYGLAGRLGWTLHVVHAVGPDETPLPPAKLRKLSWSHPGPAVSFARTAGTAVDALLDAGRHAGLVVVGAKGLTGSPGWGLGGVSDHVSAKADCSVLVVKPR